MGGCKAKAKAHLSALRAWQLWEFWWPGHPNYGKTFNWEGQGALYCFYCSLEDL